MAVGARTCPVVADDKTSGRRVDDRFHGREEAYSRRDHRGDDMYHLHRARTEGDKRLPCTASPQVGRCYLRTVPPEVGTCPHHNVQGAAGNRHRHRVQAVLCMYRAVVDRKPRIPAVVVAGSCHFGLVAEVADMNLHLAEAVGGTRSKTSLTFN